MTEKEALTRVKTGNFNGGYGFDMQLLIDAVGAMGEKLRNGQISEVVRCKDCKHFFDGEHIENCCDVLMEKGGWLKEISVSPDWFCANGERR